MPRSVRRITLDVGMSGRPAAPRGVDDSAQQVAPGLLCRCGAHSTAGQDDQQIQNGDGDQGKDDDFGDGHGRFLIVVGYGRSDTIVNQIAAECDLAHTFAAKAKFIASEAFQ